MIGRNTCADDRLSNCFSTGQLEINGVADTQTLDRVAECVSPYALAIREALAQKDGRTLVRFSAGTLEVEVRAAANSIWALIRRPGNGGLALRAAYLPVAFTCEKLPEAAGECARIGVSSAMGRHIVSFVAHEAALDQLRVTVQFVPKVALLMPFMPRDLYPLDANDDPLGAHGQVEARQRGLNSGLLYFTLDRPAFGSVLYFQNLTALNPYYQATGTKPEDVVGGEWPELGLLLPTPPESEPKPEQRLAAGETVVLSDAILVFRREAPQHERESARRFIQMLGEAYQMLDLPGTEFRDWIGAREPYAARPG